MSPASTVIQRIEQWLRNLELDRKAIGQSDDECRASLERDGYLIEGRRLTRAELEMWQARLERLLQTCRERRNAKDDDFFDVVFWYAATAIFEHDEREASFREMIGRQRGRLSGPARRAKNSARLDRAAAALNELRKGNEIRRFRKAEIAEKAKLNPGALQHTSTKKIAARARELRNALLKR